MQRPAQDRHHLDTMRPVPCHSLSRRRLLRRLWDLSLYAAACAAGRCALSPDLRVWAEGAGSVVHGRVVDLVTEQPLAGVRLSAMGAVTETDEDGRYTLRLPQGVDQVRATHPGYIGMTRARIRLGADGGQLPDWEMIPTAPDEAAQAVIEEKQRAYTWDRSDVAWQESGSLGSLFVAAAEPPTTLRVLMPDGTVETMLMEEYLRGVVPYEMPTTWPMEALKAQAVAARSYASTRKGHGAVGADVCTTSHCQVWRATYNDRTDAAVCETCGVVARSAGQIINAFFFSHCDGHTRNSEDVFTTPLPYCRSVPCSCGNTFMRGHGVGVCQHGAQAMTLQGHSYAEILAHYYTGITVLPSPCLPELSRRVYLPLVVRL